MKNGIYHLKWNLNQESSDRTRTKRFPRSFSSHIYAPARRISWDVDADAGWEVEKKGKWRESNQSLLPLSPLTAFLRIEVIVP